MHLQVYVNSLYMKICHFVVDVILFIFAYCRGRNRQFRDNMQVLQEKDQEKIMVQNQWKREADVILLIATYVIFVKSSYIST